MDRSDYLKVESLGHAIYELLKGEPAGLACAAVQEVLCCAILNSVEDPLNVDVDKLVQGIAHAIAFDLKGRIKFLKEHPGCSPSGVVWFPERE
jgi:hypothetical protein